MTDTEIKIQTDAIDIRIGEVKSVILAQEKIATDAAAVIASSRLELTRLRNQRDDLLTPELF